ncbi:MAG TPA: MFS transporter [Streptosporangiaceae bacterium]
MPSPAVPRAQQSPFTADLRSVLGEPGFRRLFATRLISQAGDGIYTAGFGAYVFFSATTYPDPAAAAAAFAVLYLPYSFIGPFAGVFIDRWSRRQILLVSALVRAVLVAITALLVGSGELGVPVYVSALAALGVNRFFLASLSAALPHVVPDDKLVMANSVAPTIGGIVTTVAGVAGIGIRLLLGGGTGSAAVIMLVAACGYLLAGLAAAAMSRDLLGPVHEPGTGPGSLPAELRDVLRGLAAGVRYLTRRPGPAGALGAVGGYRVLFGIVFLMSILLYRNHFYPGGDGNAALSHFTLVVVVTAAGYGLAAVISPVVTRRLSKPTWITVLLAASGLVMTLGATFRQLPFLLIGFVLGLTGQGIAISATTIIQEQTSDTYRGRAFALYDMMFNGVFVAGAVAGAAIIGADGRSYPLIAVTVAGYLLTALGYARYGTGRSRQEPAAGASGGPDRPSASAQASSS